jgi:hypothetical protein
MGNMRVQCLIFGKHETERARAGAVQGLPGPKGARHLGQQARAFGQIERQERGQSYVLLYSAAIRRRAHPFHERVAWGRIIGQLDVDDSPGASGFEGFVKRRIPSARKSWGEKTACVHGAQVRQSERCHAAVARRRTVHHFVMYDDHLPVRAQLGIQFISIRAVPECELKRSNGVFGCLRGRTPVSEQDRPGKLFKHAAVAYPSRADRRIWQCAPGVRARHTQNIGFFWNTLIPAN